jgi:hypothetical protein
MMTNIFDGLGTRTSALAQDALTRRCGVCHAEPDNDCTSLVDGYPLQARIVHIYRTAA